MQGISSSNGRTLLSKMNNSSRHSVTLSVSTDTRTPGPGHCQPVCPLVLTHNHFEIASSSFLKPFLLQPQLQQSDLSHSLSPCQVYSTPVLRFAFGLCDFLVTKYEQ